MALAADAVKTVIAAVWPQREEFETGRFYGWRISIALMALTVTGVLTMHIAWAFGFVTLFGTTGFALAGDVSDIKLQQQVMNQKIDDRASEIMAIVIGGQVFELRTKECAARKASNEDARAAYSQQRQTQMETYARVAKRAYPLEPCP